LTILKPLPGLLEGEGGLAFPDLRRRRKEKKHNIAN
jgi:hypothetical protein